VLILVKWATAHSIASSDLVDLKKKWEEDKEEIQKLRKSRRFKPY
jgi:hypothetical protein